MTTFLQFHFFTPEFPLSQNWLLSSLLRFSSQKINPVSARKDRASHHSRSLSKIIHFKNEYTYIWVNLLFDFSHCCFIDYPYRLNLAIMLCLVSLCVSPDCSLKRLKECSWGFSVRKFVIDTNFQIVNHILMKN